MKRGREDGGTGAGRGKRARLSSSDNGTSTLQVVNVEPFARKTLAETARLLGESASSILGMLRSHPEFSAETSLISPDTRLNIWNSIRVQVSQDPDEGLQRIRGSMKFCTSDDADEHPDPVLYLKDPHMDPTHARIEGELKFWKLISVTD